MLGANQSPKEQKRNRKMNQEECPDQLDLVQTSLDPERLRNRRDLHLTYSKICESGRSNTNGTIIHYTKTPD